MVRFEQDLLKYDESDVDSFQVILLKTTVACFVGLLYMCHTEQVCWHTRISHAPKPIILSHPASARLFQDG
jgi:hypothetical protein